MQFKVIVVVDRCLGGHFEERFTVIDLHFDFRFFLVHAPLGINAVNEFGVYVPSKHHRIAKLAHYESNTKGVGPIFEKLEIMPAFVPQTDTL